MAEKVEIILEAEDKASKEIDNVGLSLSGLAKGAGALALGGLAVAGGAIAGISAATIDFVKAAAESQEVEMRMRAQLNALGDTAKVSADDIMRLADELSKVGGFDDEELVEGQTTLLRFGNLSKEQFEKATRAAADLAAITGMSLPSAFQQVGIALDQPEQGFGRLRRYIGDLTKEQEAAVKASLELGDTMGAQTIILDALSQKTKGAAETMGDTLTGQLNKFNTTIGNIKETIGAAFLPTIQLLADKLLAFVQGDQFEQWVQTIADWLQNQLPIAIQTAADFWENTLKPALDKLVPIFINDLLPAFLKLAEFMGVILPPLITLFVGGWELIYKGVQAALTPFRNAIDGLEFLSQKFTEFWNKVKDIPWVRLGIDIITGISDGIRQATSNLILAAVNAAVDAYNAVKAALGIGSPAKMGIYLGEMFTAGIVEGMKINTPALQVAGANSVSAMLPSYPAGGGGRGGSPINITYAPTISTASPQEFEAALVPLVDSALRRVNRRR